MKWGKAGQPARSGRTNFQGVWLRVQSRALNNLISVTDIPLCLNTLEVHRKAECEVGLKRDAWVFPRNIERDSLTLQIHQGFPFCRLKKKKIVPSSRG